MNTLAVEWGVEGRLVVTLYADPCEVSIDEYPEIHTRLRDILPEMEAMEALLDPAATFLPYLVQSVARCLLRRINPALQVEGRVYPPDGDSACVWHLEFDAQNWLDVMASFRLALELVSYARYGDIAEDVMAREVSRLRSVLSIGRDANLWPKNVVPVR